MKFVRISLAIILPLLLIGLICPAVQASEESGSVDLSATVPLAISDVSASNIGYHRATISWETNGNATSQVFYDTKSTEDTTLVSEHSITLTGLSSSTTYHYRVRSAIPDTEFVAISEDYTFKTLTPVAPPPPAPTGGGGRVAPPTIDTNLFGVEWSYRISDDGEILTTITATSEDGLLAIRVPVGTIALDKYGNPLDSLEAAVDESPPDPPEDAHIIGLAYDFSPEGATFDPGITLTWSYDPDALPEGVAEEDLVIAYYDQVASKWVEVDCVVDTENNTITASVEHFTTFTIIGAVTPAPPPPPPAPAAFSLSSLTVKPLEVELKEAVTISVSVANTGGTEGSYSVVLKINGVKEAEKRVTVAAGSIEMWSLFVEREEPGTYSVTVDGLSGSFTVVAPPGKPAVVPPEVKPPVLPVKPPFNWPLVGGIIGGIVVIGLLIFFFVRRRAHKQGTLVG